MSYNPHVPDEENDAEEVDKVDQIIDQSGCAKELYESKECQFKHRDWRACRDTTQKLKDCMIKMQQNRENAAMKNISSKLK